MGNNIFFSLKEGIVKVTQCECRQGKKDADHGQAYSIGQSEKANIHVTK
jgi:hypothetical protein